MPPMPAEAEAPPDLVTPLTASAGALGALGALLQLRDGRKIRIEQIEVGNVARKLRRIGKTGERVFGRRPRHGDRALGELGDVGLDVVGRHHRLARPDEHAQPHVVALGALGFLDGALAHLDRKGYRAHRERVGGVGTGAASRRDEPVGEVGQRGLVKE